LLTDANSLPREIDEVSDGAVRSVDRSSTTLAGAMHAVFGPVRLTHPKAVRVAMVDAPEPGFELAKAIA